MAKFMFLQYVTESESPRPGTPELDNEIAAYGKLVEEVQAKGMLRGGDPFQPSTAGFSVQVRGGATKVTDGPMYTASPWLNGYWVLDCRDRDEAIAFAAKIPAAHGSGTVEVHPVSEM
jgi:hypothetical protein